MNKIKIGIEINDKNYSGKNFSALNKGNPGIGGIPHQMLLMGCSLKEYYSDSYTVIYFHYSDKNIYPLNCEEIVCTDNINVIQKANEEKIDYLFVDCNKPDIWYEGLRKLNLNIILRAGCYLDYKEIANVMKTKQIARVVCVAPEEYDYYRDHDIIDRMICIENSMSYETLKRRKKDAFSSHTVTYIGSLVPQKGFHYLAKIWPKILKKVPDAKLKVLGSGQLYNTNQKLGSFSIAESKYENSFMHYLTDKNGTILPSVTFCGIVGSGKSEILQDTSVGVVNPSALTETFCTSAIDFASCGIPVVTRAKWGLPGTVINKKTGLTYKGNIERGLLKNILKLLTNEALNNKLGVGAESFAKNFDRKNMSLVWNTELQSLYKGNPCIYRKANGNYSNGFKWLRILNAFLRRKLGLRWLPSILDIKNGCLDMGRLCMKIFRKTNIFTGV